MRQSRKTLAVALLCALMVPACAPDTVRADDAGVWGPNVSLTRIVAIGSTDGPDEYAFGRIKSFVGAADGSFYVYDGQDVLIRAYDANGKFVRSIGRNGDGPGEYREILGMQLLGDSVLAVWDVRASRVSYFSSGGAFKTSTTFPSANRFYADDVFGIDPSGTIYLLALAKRVVAGELWQLCYVRLLPSGAIIDSLPIPFDESPSGIRIPTQNGPRTNFLTATVSVLSPLGGLISGRNDRYAISVPGSASDRPMVIERRYTPVPLRGEERAEWEAIARNFETVSKAPPRPGVGRDDPFLPPTLPAVKPPFRDISADGDGRIWVELNAAAEKHTLPPPPATPSPFSARLSWFDAATFDVFDREGKFLGTVTLPEKSVFLAARGDRVWVRSTGPNDEEVIVVHRIVGKGL